jgi:hypothetical protein
MTKHVAYQCPPGQHDHEDYPRPCAYCDGGLFCCAVCGGAEASCPTDCPERRLTGDELDDIQAGILDFIDGDWVRLS